MLKLLFIHHGLYTTKIAAYFYSERFFCIYHDFCCIKRSIFIVKNIFLYREPKIFFYRDFFWSHKNRETSFRFCGGVVDSEKTFSVSRFDISFIDRDVGPKSTVDIYRQCTEQMRTFRRKARSRNSVESCCNT